MIKELLPLQKELIGAAIGLSKACYVHEKKKTTDQVIIHSLVTVKHTTDTSVTLEMLRKVQAEKKLVAPGCSTCMTPCGNTNDYNLQEVIAAEKEVFEVKDRILESLLALAEREESAEERDLSLIYRGLSVISYDVPVERLQTVANQLQRQLDKNSLHQNCEI